jgi:hypothetical protein
MALFKENRIYQFLARQMEQNEIQHRPRGRPQLDFGISRPG